MEYCEILLQFKITFFYFNIFQKVIYFCDVKADVSSHYLSVTWSFRNHYNMLIMKHFILLSKLKTVVLLKIFVETVIHFFQDSVMNTKFKRTAFI